MNRFPRALRPISAFRLLLQPQKTTFSRRFYAPTTKANDNMPPYIIDIEVPPKKPEVMTSEIPWGYCAHNGPHTWAKYDDKAAGLNQSPVNIDMHRVVYDQTLPRSPVRLKQTTCSNGVMLNYGRGFRIEFSSDARLSGGPLKRDYSFEQFHMHWGPSKYYGSEHAIDGKSYAAELHIVFIDRSRYPTFSDVLQATDRDALCVLGVFINEGAENPALEPIIERLPSIAYRDQRSPLPHQMLLFDLLPKNRREYFTYPGSLTAPPCLEVVQWILYRDHITMSERQLNMCRSIYETLEGAQDHSKCDINCRTCCPLGSRVVRSSFPITFG